MVSIPYDDMQSRPSYLNLTKGSQRNRRIVILSIYARIFFHLGNKRHYFYDHNFIGHFTNTTSPCYHVVERHVSDSFI